MGGRGRGRGGGGARGGSNKSFSREQLNTIGGNEVLPVPVTQPPPLFPMLLRKPIPVTPTVDMDYLLLLKQDLIDHMNLSVAYLKMPQSKENQPEKEIDNLLAQLPKSTKEKFDWSLFPQELRPKLVAKRGIEKKVVVKKEIDIESRLEQLQQLEEKTETLLNTVIKTEVEDEQAAEEEEEIEDEDEEMDDGTDYANNYFDNGEAYEDEDDNLDDGPSY